MQPEVGLGGKKRVETERLLIDCGIIDWMAGWFLGMNYPRESTDSLMGDICLATHAHTHKHTFTGQLDNKHAYIQADTDAHTYIENI